MNLRRLWWGVLMGASVPAFAADWHALTGAYAVTAEHYLDPAPDEPANSHFRLQLSDAAAKDLYLAIPGEPEVDACTGGLAKTVGELQCVFLQAGPRYQCAFSIDLRDGSVSYGVAC